MSLRLARLVLFVLVAALPLAAQDKTLPLPDSGQVTLTLDEYNKLVELASKSPKKLDLAPLPYSLKHAGASLRVESDSVRGTLELQGEVLRKGVSKVALTSGITILDAHQNGKGVPLIQENGKHAALLPGPGEFSLALDTALPLKIEAGRASFVLPAPEAGSVQVSVTIPGDHTIANVSPGLITSRKSANGRTTVEATLAPGQPATFWWATREVVAPVVPREVRFLSNIGTLVSVSEAEMRLAVLADLTVIQGEPAQFQVELPLGYEVTGVTGATLDSTEVQGSVLTLKVNAPAQKAHQFLISLERSINGTTSDTPFLSFKAAQRETGELLVEGSGTMEITAKEGGGVKRMDVKEASPYLRSLAHFPPQAAFRFHRQPNETPTLALDWVRFPDGSVLAAVAESAVVTTLVTSEGKSLTEIKLILKNQAQPYLKVSLPAGANIVSADVAGEPVKPVQGADGSRVPLLRPGFRPTDSYTVSFVFMHSGAPFAKKGGTELALPGMDIPIDLLNWEVFLPEQYKVKDFGGDVIAAQLVPPAFRADSVSYAMPYSAPRDSALASNVNLSSLLPGQVGGLVSDPSGAVVPNARVTVTEPSTGYAMSTVTDQGGRWVLSNLRTGQIKIEAQASGFRTNSENAVYDANHPTAYNSQLAIGAATETVEVMAEAEPMRGTYQASPPPPSRIPSQQAASANVLNLQKRVAGVLPVPVDVPRAGTSFAFVRPLVLDEETKVTFSYKSR